jgi:hypothetical protein
MHFPSIAASRQTSVGGPFERHRTSLRREALSIAACLTSRAEVVLDRPGREGWR